MSKLFNIADFHTFAKKRGIRWDYQTTYTKKAGKEFRRATLWDFYTVKGLTAELLDEIKEEFKDCDIRPATVQSQYSPEQKFTGFLARSW